MLIPLVVPLQAQDIPLLQCRERVPFRSRQWHLNRLPIHHHPFTKISHRVRLWGSRSVRRHHLHGKRVINQSNQNAPPRDHQVPLIHLCYPGSRGWNFSHEISTRVHCERPRKTLGRVHSEISDPHRKPRYSNWKSPDVHPVALRGKKHEELSAGEIQTVLGYGPGVQATKYATGS